MTALASPLFPPGSRFTFFPLPELAAELGSPQPRLLLPTFQRDAIWDEQHVELLWDSVLRGFPVGALLVARRPPALQVRRLQRGHGEPAQPTQTDGADLVLVDGQQRAIAIALGFRAWTPEDPVRLWIDLAEGEAQGGYRLRLCSLRYPWGRGARDHHRREALALLGAGGLPEDEQAWLGVSWPADMIAPVPVAELLAPDVPCAEWHALLPQALRTRARQSADAPWAAKVLQAARRVRDYLLPAVLLDDLGSLTDLGDVFQRLNTQGVAMSQEDLFFSGIKLHWPPAHDLVWQIHRDPAAGRILSPTKVVHAATRLASNLRLEPRRDVVRLDVDQFRKLMEIGDDGPSSQGSFLVALAHFLQPGAAPCARGRLHRYLRLAREALAYRPLGDLGVADPGLPAPLLARVRWRVWHTIVAWLARRDRRALEPDDRAELVRYALFDLLAAGHDSDALVRATVEVALGSPSQFPGKQIYQRLREGGDQALVLHPVTLPEEFAIGLEDEQGNPTTDPFPGEHVLVMWAQRSFLARCFPAFDPTRYARSEDLPYDVDHILPWSIVNRRGRNNAGLAPKFWDYRGPLVGGPGNLRYWPRSENRSDQDKNPEQKLLLGARGEALPKLCHLRSSPWELTTFGAVRDASALPDHDLKHWRKLATGAAGDYDWTDPARLKALKKAVLHRRAWIYRRLFEEAGFGQWIHPEHPALIEDGVATTAL